MKKYIIIMLMGCLFGGFQPMANAQTLGSWVISTTDNFTPSDPGLYQVTYLTRLDFTSSPIPTSIYLSNTMASNDNLFSVSTSSEYNDDQSIACFAFTGSQSIHFYNSNFQLKQTETLYSMNHTSRIVPRPADESQFCAVYCGKGTTKIDHGLFYVTSIDNPDNNLTIDPHTFDGKFIETTDFCLSPELNNERMIYYTSELNGLSRIGIEQVLNGTQLSEIILPNNYNGFEGHFNAHEMEMKQSGLFIHIIWSTAESSGDLYHVTYDLNTSTSQTHIYHVGEGIIAGVEFSSFDANIVYLSCENSGVVEYHLDNQQKFVYAGSGNYNKSSLQTAPNGYIYAVKNSGDYLGYINQQNSIFTPEVFRFQKQIPENYGYLANKRSISNEAFFMLPKDDHVYIPLQATVDVKPESCPNTFDGEVWITVTGGAPFSPPDDPYLISSDPELNFTWEEDNSWFHAEGLTAGTYGYTITDGATPNPNVITSTFIIKENDDYYDYKNDYYEVSENRSLPDDDMPLNTYSFEEGILIRSGATLTITGSVYEFGKWAKVIIEPGATLELVGSTLTNHEECHLQWQGVEVQGNSDLPQQPELIDGVWVYHQARLIMQNATIENAIEGVGLLQRNENNKVLWEKAGGILVANNSHFINNVNSVHFIPYKNINYNAIAEIGNASYFSNCTFDLNVDYIGDDYTFYKHVDLDKVKGIEFRGCTFTNTATNGVSQYNLGIAAYDAGFTVESRCTQGIDPCPEEYMDKSTFNGFYNGIRATSDGSSTNTFIVTNSEFENNAIGIFASKVNLNTIVDNNFKVGYSTPGKVYDECKGLVNSLGIDMQYAYGFAIENNTFVKPETSTGQGDFAGIRVYACPSVKDVIYKNTFDGLTYGNYAQGTNRSRKLNDATGVEYQCNRNGQSVDNSEDFMVTYIEDAEDGMVTTDHGSWATASGNTFSKSAVHIRNEGEQKIIWNYCLTCTDEEPTEIIPDDIVYIQPVVAVNPNTCPEHYNGGGSVKLSTSELLSKEMEFAQNLSDYNSVESLIESLKDGGNTDSELSDILSAQPDDMWSLRSQLLGDSPHLTKEVLMTMSDRTDVFPDDVLFEILAANPDELSKDTLISYLENKENPLPDYMIDILKQLVGGVTYKTILLREKTDYYEGKTKAAQDILRSILNDSIMDTELYRNWLDNLGGLNADKQLVASYFSEGDTSSAMALLNMISSFYEFQGDELAEFNDYQSLLLLQEGWKQSGKHIVELDSMDLVTLYNYAENSTGSARSIAQNILTYAENAHFCDCMHSNDSTNAKMGGTSLGNSLNRIYGLEITATPNPARVYVAFNYQLPEGKPEGIISISDLAGKEIQRFAVSGKQGQQVWDIRSTKSGVYLYTLTTGGLQKTGKVIIN